MCQPGGVPDFADLSLLPFCAGLTLLGLIGSWAAFRRRGVTAGVRGVAWSLLPVSLYLTGLLELLWDVAKAAVDFAGDLVFSPKVWAGAALLGVSIVLLVLTGVVRSRGVGTKEKKPAEPPAELTATGPEPAKAPKPAAKPAKAKKADDGEFDEIEEILKRHGIN
jgi:hypothetical protein